MPDTDRNLADEGYDDILDDEELQDRYDRTQIRRRSPYHGLPSAAEVLKITPLLIAFVTVGLAFIALSEEEVGFVGFLGILLLGGILCLLLYAAGELILLFVDMEAHLRAITWQMLDEKAARVAPDGDEAEE